MEVCENSATLVLCGYYLGMATLSQVTLESAGIHSWMWRESGGKKCWLASFLPRKPIPAVVFQLHNVSMSV